ncbi:amino acid adenylation domain-containing protein [Paenibacillus elgii]
MSQRNGLEIAVIGMACRFPGAGSIDEYWNNLVNGIETISSFSDEELLEAGVDPELLKNPNYVKAKGFIEDIEYFDAAFFNFSSREAEIMDPQIRVLHECSWEALEHAGYCSSSYDGEIGFYAGASTNFNWLPMTSYGESTLSSEGFEAGTLGYKDAISTLIAYKLNLKGPSLALYSACSTSLSAIHQACRGLLLGECSIALAGGVSVGYPKKKGYLYQEGMIESRDGHCRSFDAKADGSVFGDGAGIVVLKRLEDALEDGDTIHAVVKATAMNNDGARKVGYTAPSVEGQAEVVRKALHLAEVDEESIGYIEAHGSGTSMGDPIEIKALEKAFDLPSKHVCGVGSVKSNVGHLDAASGVAGFIKTVLALKHKQIPPSLHYETPNPEIQFETSPFYVNHQLTEWKNDRYPLRAGVSSFGLGGTNVHVVLEEAALPEESSAGRPDKLLVLSARSEKALAQVADNLAAFLERDSRIDLGDVAYTLQVGRDVFPYRRAVVCSSVEEAVAGLKSFSGSGGHALSLKEKQKQAVFMFSGQSAQYVQMGRELYDSEPVFRETMDAGFERFAALAGYPLKSLLYPAEATAEAQEQINRTEVSQPVLFIFEYALAKLLISWGIQPSAVIGYSFGEYAAACIAGVFSFEEALSLVVQRGKLMQTLPRGAMLSVPLPEEELRPLLEEGVSIAVVNHPACIVSGAEEAIKRFEQKMKEQKLFCMRLNSSHAGHSSMMVSVADALQGGLQAVQFQRPEIPYISGMTGTTMDPGAIANVDYWLRQLAEPVRFSDGIGELCTHPGYVFIEIGPGRELTTMIRRHVDGKSHHAVDLIQPEAGKMTEPRYLLRQLGKLWSYGVRVQWNLFHGEERRHRIPLPTYPFEKKYYWPDADKRKQLEAKAQESAGQRKSAAPADWFYVPSWKQSALKPSLRLESLAGTYLVLADDFGVTEALGARLGERGAEVIMVRSGSCFEAKSATEYTLNPGSEEEYRQLLEAVQKSGRTPSRILHAFSLQAKPEGQSVAQAQERGYYSLLYLAKALARVYLSAETQIDVVTNNIFEVHGGEHLFPEHSTILGPCKVIPQEYANIWCRNVDIAIEEIGRPKLIHQLAAEFTHASPEQTVSLRNGRRWTVFYEQVPLDKADGADTGLKDGGVYLLTGGTGGIALELAAYLARTRKAQLALLHRSFFPAREDWNDWVAAHEPEDQTSGKIRKLLEIEALGGGLMLEQADVSELEQMRAAVGRIEQRFGRVSGVIHAAGTLSHEAFAAVRETGRSESEPQFNAKLHGTIVLDTIFKDREPDFCLLMSSIASVLGGPGQAAYCAANTFLDAYAAQRNRTSAYRWLSVNWDGWRVKKNEDGAWGEIWEETAMTAAEGVDAFERVLGCIEVSQVVNSTANLQARIDAWSGPAVSQRAETPHRSAELMARPDLSTAYVPPRNDTEQALAEIFQQIVRVDGIGVHDDFLELGGDSLKAITVLSTIRKQFNTDIPLKEFFNNLTVERIAGLMREKSSPDSADSAGTELAPIGKRPYYPVSSAQKRMYLLDQIHTDSTLYNTTILKNVPNTVTKPVLEQVFRALIERHDSLRTSFVIVEDVPYQQVADEIPFFIQEWDLSSEPERIPHVLEAFVKPFDLSKAPLLRVGFLHTGDDKNIIIIDIHHIITDLLSMDLLQQDFKALLNGKKLAPLPLQYKDYAVWLQSRAYQERLQSQERYWLARFSTKPPLLNLPTDFPRGKVKTYAGSSYYFELGTDETGALRRLAREQDATLFMILLSAFNVLLYRLSGQTDLVVGVPVAGRSHKEMESILGLFVNTLPLRNPLSGDCTFTQLLGEIKVSTLEAFEHQEYPFEDLVERIVVERDTGRNPLFDVMFNLLDRREEDNLDEDHATEKAYGFNRTSKFDLSLTVREAKHKLFFEIEYSTELFRESTIQRFGEYYGHLLQAVMHNRTAAISELELLPEQELRRIYGRLNNVRTPYPEQQTIAGLIEERARKHPDKTALWCKGESMTYAELSRKSNQLAQTLRNRGAGRGRMVGVMLEHSFEAVIAILAVMKSGAAYVPIDPEYPEERIRFLLEDSRADMILVSDRTAGRSNFACPMLNVRDERLYDAPGTIPAAEPAVDDPVYVIYTSGSTGMPKGVVISHRSLMNHIYWAIQVYMKEEDEIICPLYSSLSFDLTVTSLFAPLVTGNQMVIYQGDSKDVVIQRVLEDNRVNLIKLTPTHLRLIRELGIRAPKVRTFVVNGELLRTSLANDIYHLFEGKADIYNEYGPTEATVGCTVHRFDPQQDCRLSVPVGTPVSNARIYLLDERQRLVPEGIPGEIYISGDGVAQRYLYRPELTQEKFLPDPFEPGLVMYRTGDLARLLPDGKLEFLGRQDHQVKIRGFRIELGEVSKVLEKHEAVKEGVVVARGSDEADDKYLCGYYVAHPSSADEPELKQEIRQFLTRQLPAYLVPPYLIRLDAFPVTPNGKLDMKGLPAPEILEEHSFAAAETEEEKTLAQLWAAVLNRDAGTLSINANFFELGGHSLRAAILASRMHKTFHIKVPLIEIFNRPTVRELALYVKEASAHVYVPIPKVSDQPYYELAPAQRKLYFLQKLNPDDTSYNLPMFWELSGNFDLPKFKEVFEQLRQRHESLQTSFVEVNGEPYQQVQPDADWEIEYHDVSRDADPQAAAERILQAFVRPFDLAGAPLRVGLIQTGAHRHILMVDVHHIVTDGVSMGILARDFMALFAGDRLPELKVRYRDYAAWYNRLSETDSLDKQKAFWKEQFRSPLPVLNLPADFARPKVRSFEGGRIEFALSEDVTGPLKQLALDEGVTLYIVLLSAFNVLLSKLSGQEDIIVGTDTAGRGHEDVQEVIGNFTNTLALRNYPKASLSFAEFAADVKLRMLQAYDNQDYQFEDVVELVAEHRDLSRHPLFDVMFAFLSSDIEQLTMSGLTLRPYSYEQRTAMFDLVLQGLESHGKVNFQLEYSTKLFTRRTVDMFVASFHEIIAQILTNRYGRLTDIRITHGLQTTSAGKPADLEGDFMF